MELKLGFGKQDVKLEIDSANLMGVLEPNKVEISLTGEAEVKRALSFPIASPHLSNIVKKGEKIVIVTSDITRPMPSKVVLPPLLEELHVAGIPDEDITIVSALGSHRKHTEEEMKYLAGEEICKRVRCIDLDVNVCAPLGITSTGTPVNIFRPVVEADRRICLGNIEYHYFAGYSGGAKAIMPGVSTREAIQKNHSMMVLDEAKAGAIATNPLRQDIDEVARFVPIDFILNVVLDKRKISLKLLQGTTLRLIEKAAAFLMNYTRLKLRDQLI
ncbi:MAG: nickel-dependent lactate racemase family protein [Clostridia bacterium]